MRADITNIYCVLKLPFRFQLINFLREKKSITLAYIQESVLSLNENKQHNIDFPTFK